ncbi:YbgA family protein [Bacillaceae bacterium SIJ1]|uniref:DUF1722 domain-containing protein n=1 Tax=Litoribacterium kuwaitense TaxID=1398745 RepID=UPI0013EA789E|nr:DUF1722 domain-containing protein [Litoribacterium kuwaitense]NGP44740.1 YbgA family protein [Litoribacterium kuwaitense]
MTEKDIRKATEKLWAQNKYNSMAKGYSSYEAVKRAFSEASDISDYHRIFLRIQNLHYAPYSVKALVNTFEHIWGYFKNEASSEEKERFFELLSACQKFQEEDQQKYLPDEARRVIAYIHRLLHRHPVDYLNNSTLLFNTKAWNDIQLNSKHYAVSEYVYVDRIRVMEGSPAV